MVQKEARPKPFILKGMEARILPFYRTLMVDSCTEEIYEARFNCLFMADGASATGDKRGRRLLNCLLHEEARYDLT